MNDQHLAFVTDDQEEFEIESVNVAGSILKQMSSSPLCLVLVDHNGGERVVLAAMKSDTEDALADVATTLCGSVSVTSRKELTDVIDEAIQCTMTLLKEHIEPEEYICVMVNDKTEIYMIGSLQDKYKEFIMPVVLALFDDSFGPTVVQIDTGWNSIYMVEDGGPDNGYRATVSVDGFTLLQDGTPQQVLYALDNFIQNIK